jgi:hypothetical protein
VRGVVELARSGLAPSESRMGVSTGVQRHATLELPAGEVRAVAREHGASSSALLLAVLAEAMHRLESLDGATGGPVSGGTAGRAVLRAMVASSTRLLRSGAEGGNWTAALALDLPIGPMPPAQRLAVITTRLRELNYGGLPAATAAVLAALGLLPARLYFQVVRLISGRRFFDLLVSVLPGSRLVHRLAGARVSAAFPVMPLGSTPLAVGFLHWTETVGVGVTADQALLEPEELAERLRAAFEDFRIDRARSWVKAR